MEVDNLEKQAIQAAIKGNWSQAIEFNNQLIKKNPQNIAAFNRLAKALWELGKVSQAKKTYQKVLRFDPYNEIAKKRNNAKKGCEKGGKFGGDD